jgi:hypothetical protein
MRNQMASTQTPAHLDYLEEGCVIDGSHQHPDDFSVAVIRYAERLGYKIGDEDLVHILIRELGMQPKMGPDYDQDFGHYLSIASDEAVDWLNDKVCDDKHGYVIEESDLFLKHVDEIESD